ncbi:hypothetical protein F4V43_18345 [Paenibacillus spiritus]|uniref:Uncharacterized protein n=1 Tax=Paenibacillus spiritus TaxID=2496557 RepID=A0A5J5FVD8_9BACL|nr:MULTISPECIES: hypothetical protein [Paenibacillus]KAA8996840.1 hypothetical protein F4V43_18345 [Paenibacillus spiritus]
MTKQLTSLEALVKQGWVVSDSKVATNDKTGEAVVIVGNKVLGLRHKAREAVVRVDKGARRQRFMDKKLAMKPSREYLTPITLLQNETSDNELFEIADYASKELARLTSQYKGDTLESMKALVAVHIGHMILSLKDYDAIPPRNLDVIFIPFGTTFKQIERDIEQDIMRGEE